MHLFVSFDFSAYLSMPSRHPSQKEEWALSDFEIGKRLGEGKFGKVYLARETTVRFSSSIRSLCLVLLGFLVLQMPISAFFLKFRFKLVWDFRFICLVTKCWLVLVGLFFLLPQSGYIVALKVIFLEKLDKYQHYNQLNQEIKIQSDLNHPNVLRLYTWFRNETAIYLVLEYAAGGELYKELKSHGRFSEKQSATVSKQAT